MSMNRKRDQIPKGWTNKKDRSYGDLVIMPPPSRPPPMPCAGKCCHCYLVSPDSQTFWQRPNPAIFHLLSI